jgi:two-component system, NarL family, sensor histidine kinase BarA
MHLPARFKGIRFRLFFIAFFPALLLVLALTYYFVTRQFLIQEQAVFERGQSLSKDLAIVSSQALKEQTFSVLQKLANQLLAENNIIYVSIKDNRGHPLATASNIYSLDQRYKRVFKANIFANPGSLGDDKLVIGSVEIIVETEYLNRAHYNALLNSAVITMISLGLSSLLAFRLSKHISGPIIRLTHIAGALAQGNMDARAETSSIYELDILSQSFNSMAIGLQQTQNYLLEQVDNAVKELTVAMAILEEKNKTLQNSSQIAVAQNETKTQFLAHISHEVRTPMNGIIGFTDLLLESKLTAFQTEQAQMIKTSALNMLTIINEILDYSSLETGNFKTETKSFDLRECIENCVAAIPVRNRKTHLLIDVSQSTPHLINSDPIRIGQILTNLTGNACKFTEQGTITIRCCLTRTSNLFISVTDTGKGIEPDYLEQLFKPFLQPSQYAVNNEVSTGLGLSISKNIVQRMGGEIGVKSKSGAGSVFWFKIPVSCPPSQPKPSQNGIITLIDSFTARRNALKKQLHYMGYSCRCFDNASLYLPFAQQQETVIYAPPNTVQSLLEFDQEADRIRSYINDQPLIFMTHPKHRIIPDNCFYYPCRSTYLQKLLSTVVSPHPVSHPPFTPDLAEPLDFKVKDTFSIFIADDNEINRLLLKSQLENNASEIVLAEDGQEAITQLEQQPFNLIFMDLQMPYYSGLEVLQKIKQPGKPNAETPVIAITAHAQNYQRKRLIAAGFDECLIKPILMEKLQEVLNVWHLTDNAIDPNNSSSYVMQMLEKTTFNKALAHTLFSKLFSELPTQIEDIKIALDKGAITQAQQITHKLHGSVSFCGFTDLQHTAYRLETSLLAENMIAAQEYFANLQQKIDAFCAQKSSIFNTLIAH